VFVGNGIEKGHDIVHSGLKGGSKLAQTLDDVGTLLRDNPYPTGDGDDDEKSYDEINELSALHTPVLLCPGLSTSFRFFLFTSYRDTAKSNRYVPFAWLSKGFAIYLCPVTPCPPLLPVFEGGSALFSAHTTARRQK